MNDLPVSHFEAVAKATLQSEDHTVRTLSELLLQATSQLERLQIRHREALGLIGKLSAEMSQMRRRAERHPGQAALLW